MQAIIQVFEFPPKLSCNILVSLEFLKVINWAYFFYIERADITFPNYKRPRLMLIPYLRVAPVAPVFLTLQDPAKSTKTNFAVINPQSVDFSPFTIGYCSMKTEKMACDREEASFIMVEAVVLWQLPLSNSYNICSAEWTFSSVAPQMLTDPSF